MVLVVDDMPCLTGVFLRFALQVVRSDSEGRLILISSAEQAFKSTKTILCAGCLFILYTPRALE